MPLVSGTSVLHSRGMVLALLLLASGADALAQAVSGVEQVLVTARRRSEPLQQVPVSVDVISAGFLRDYHVLNLAELPQFSTNVTLFEDLPGAGIPTWIIRGVGLQDFNSNNTPTAGVYVDGVYQPATVMGSSALFDVTQVQILKGPQGGLYGRNTTGGAVLLDSQRAQPGQRATTFDVSLGRWQQLQANGSINVDLGPGLAWRGAMHLEAAGDGWQRSLASGERHGERDRLDLRSWLVWQPAAAWSLAWKVQGGRDDSDIPLGRSIGLYDSSAIGRFCAAVLAGQRDDRSCLNFGSVNRLVQRQPGLVDDLARQASDGSAVLSSTLNSQHTDYASSLLELRRMGSAVDFVSLTAVDVYDYGVALDLDAAAGEFGHRLSSSDIQVFSQEFQLLSKADARLGWMLGTVFSEERFDERRDFNLRDNTLVGLGQGKLAYRQNTRAEAFYGNINRRFGDRWKLDANWRYTQEQKQYRDGSFFRVATPPAYIVRDLRADYELGERLTGGITASFQADPHTLLYAAVSRAFKSGGFFGGFPFRPSEIQPYDEEVLVAKELGLRRQWPALGLNLEAALFTYDYQDVQGFVREVNPLTGTGVDQLDNLADARHDGAELALRWQSDTGWSAGVELGWLDARFVPGTRRSRNLLGVAVAPAGQRPYAPRWDGNIDLARTFVLTSGHQLRWVANYQYTAALAGRQSSLPDAAVNRLPGFGTLAASVTLSPPQASWSLQLWSRNLTNTVYRTRIKGDGLNSYSEFFGEPRSFGVFASQRF